MKWNWQQKEWPDFTYDRTTLDPLETKFTHNSGILIGSKKHLTEEDKNRLIVEIISEEALNTSEIEGEYLNRDSLQSSILRNFGLHTDREKIPPAEQGISDMMIDLYNSFSDPLTNKRMFSWHKMLMNDRRDIADIGRYRTDNKPMQVVSGPEYAPKIHFEAPPSEKLTMEMNRFISMFNQSAVNGEKLIPALTRSGIVHLQFVSIHPFEDGNGRIGRALSEKALSQTLGQPTLVSLSHTIQKNKKTYYDMLERNNKKNEITEWLEYFAETVLEAQNYTQSLIEFLIEKTMLYDRVRDQINPRQEKVIARMFREGMEGFKGGLSANNYIKIAQTSRATATRDLQDLVDKGVLISTGELKGTRYYLNFKSIPIKKNNKGKM